MNDNSGLILIVELIITIFCYEIFPFISVVFMNKKYNDVRAQKMALWNSIIVGAIFMIITLSMNENATWSPLPAFFYYLINRKIWINVYDDDPLEETKNEDIETDKLEKEEKIDSKVKETTTKKDDITEDEYLACDRCGGRVDESDTKCPNCGAVFEEEIEEPKEKKKKNKNKEKKKEEDESDEEYTSICSNCGEKVKESDEVCPNCGESFDEEEEEKNVSKTSTDIDKKYADLTKLKKLLDKKIITKEEFKKEKEKILKD